MQRPRIFDRTKVVAFYFLFFETSPLSILIYNINLLGIGFNSATLIYGLMNVPVGRVYHGLEYTSSIDYNVPNNQILSQSATL